MVHSPCLLSQKIHIREGTVSLQHRAVDGLRAEVSSAFNLPVSCRPALVQVAGANVLGVMVCPCPSLPRCLALVPPLPTSCRPHFSVLPFSPLFFTHAQPSLPVSLPSDAGPPLSALRSSKLIFHRVIELCFACFPGAIPPVRLFRLVKGLQRLYLPGASPKSSLKRPRS